MNISKIWNTRVFGFSAALRGQRNPMDSWDRSDSIWYPLGDNSMLDRFKMHTDAPAVIGPADMKLFTNLAEAGEEHRKAIRMIHISSTWCIPRYVWTEADTYKVATTRMSCSTMHKLGHRNLELSDFQDGDVLPETLGKLNELGQKFRDSGKKDYDCVRKMKRYLPEGFMQRADMDFSYETALNMFRQRKNHRLEEWRFVDGTTNSICDWIYGLPYMKDLIEATEK